MHLSRFMLFDLKILSQIMSINGSRVIKERPTTPVISESQKFVRGRIERRWLMLFKQTAEFMERQKPRVTAPEVVEDVMLKRRLQRSEAAWKVGTERLPEIPSAHAFRNTLCAASKVKMLQVDYWFSLFSLEPNFIKYAFATGTLTLFVMFSHFRPCEKPLENMNLCLS